MNRLVEQIRSPIGWLGNLVVGPWHAIHRIQGATTVISYAVACALPLAAWGIEEWLAPLSGHTSYQLFLGAVALSAMYGGVGNGLCTLVLSALLTHFLFLMPHVADSRTATASLLLFIGLGLMVAWLAGTLRSAQRRLHATLRFIGDAVILTNSRRQITFMNAVAEVLTGWERKDAKGRPFDDVVLLEDGGGGQRIADPVARAFQEGAAVSFEKPLLLRPTAGDASSVEGSVAPIRNSAGKITGSVTVLRDISEREVLEAELRTAQKIQALGRLTGPLAHDFNNWLTVISGHAELLRGKLTDLNTPAMRESAEAIVRAADEAGRLARQFLVFAGGPTARRGRVNVNRILDRMEAGIHAVAGDYVSVTLTEDKDLWLAWAAPEQVEQVIINLVANARAAMPSGGLLDIRTSNTYLSDEKDGHQRAFVLLEISDDGCGMDEETKARIFEPFFSRLSGHQAAGLGLSLVYSIVAQSGGKIEVTSEPAKGTAVQIYLPRFEEPPQPIRDSAEPADAVTADIMPSVLVVDSDDGVRRLIASTLRAEGYSILEAADGRKALEIAVENINHLDLVVTELATPQVTGPELATRLSLLRPDIKMVYISSYPKPASWEDSGPEPNRAFLFKPFSPSELLAQADFMLSMHPSGG